MVLDDYGKKSDLPIYNKSNKFQPRRFSDNKNLYKRIGIALISLIAVWLIFFRSTSSKPSIPVIDTSNVGQPSVDQQQPIADEGKVYKVTKEGVTEHSLNGEQPFQTPEELSEKAYKDTVNYYDLNDYKGSADGLSQGDVVLFLMPLRNAEHVLPMAFHNLMNLTYDHGLIDIAFLVSDCSPNDQTLQTVFEYSVALQNGTLVDKLHEEERAKTQGAVKGSSDLYQLYMDKDYINNVKKLYHQAEFYHKDYKKPFRSVSIFQKDFGQVIGQGFSDRHAVKVQGIRRKLMGRARNWLTSNALQPYHSWVYWRDVDIETCPGSVIQDLMKHNYDVMVPNVWRPLPTFLGNEQPYDLNSWIESEPALDLAKTLEEDDVIVEGYAEYPTWRVHLAYIRDANGNPDEVLDLDGVGGVSILARAQIFRQGVHFPAFTFLNHAETEAFGKMAKEMGFSVGGLPHYTIWHIYEPSEDDLNQIAKLERKKRRQKNKGN